MNYPLYVFDAYGTLFDEHSAVARHRDAIGAEADAMSQTWRTKQIEYTWVRSLMGAHRDFRALTADALDFSAARHGVTLGALREKLLAAYEILDAFSDAASTLQALKTRGAKTAILSNGTPAMLDSAVNSAGLGGLLDTVLSIEEAGIFKTSPRTYQLVTQRFGVPPAQTAFISSNRWDAAGATHFGFATHWINRTGAPDEYLDHAPVAVLSSLYELISS